MHHPAVLRSMRSPSKALGRGCEVYTFVDGLACCSAPSCHIGALSWDQKRSRNHPELPSSHYPSTQGWESEPWKLSGTWSRSRTSVLEWQGAGLGLTSREGLLQGLWWGFCQLSPEEALCASAVSGNGLPARGNLDHELMVTSCKDAGSCWPSAGCSD